MSSVVANKVEFQNITLLVEPTVYCPREDSFLLADAVKEFATGKVLDMGTGSGIQAIVASGKKEVTSIVAVDANKIALQCAQRNAEKNKVAKKITFIERDLFENINSESEQFDTIIYNPPYVPVEKEEKRDAESMAWYGGLNGRDYVDSFLERFPDFLSKNGKLLLLQSSLNVPEATEKKLAQLGFSFKVYGTAAFFFEKIFVLVIQRQK